MLDIIVIEVWMKSDIVETSEKDGIQPTEENINKIISYRNLKHLKEQSIERA